MSETAPGSGARHGKGRCVGPPKGESRYTHAHIHTHTHTHTHTHSNTPGIGVGHRGGRAQVRIESEDGAARAHPQVEGGAQNARDGGGGDDEVVRAGEPAGCLCVCVCVC